jgi:hypothetical protein
LSSHIHVNPWLTIWWEPRRPNVIKICTGDRRFVNDEGRKPGLWISIRRCQRNRNNWNRLARAIAARASPRRHSLSERGATEHAAAQPCDRLSLTQTKQFSAAAFYQGSGLIG